MQLYKTLKLLIMEIFFLEEGGVGVEIDKKKINLDEKRITSSSSNMHRVSNIRAGL